MNWMNRNKAAFFKSVLFRKLGQNKITFQDLGSSLFHNFKRTVSIIGVIKTREQTGIVSIFSHRLDIANRMVNENQ